MQEKRFEQPAPDPVKLPHNLIVEDRRTLTATGVTRLVSYDEQGATLETQPGTLVVGGGGTPTNVLALPPRVPER